MLNYIIFHYLMIEKKQAPAIKSYYSNIINSYAIKAIEQYLSSLTHTLMGSKVCSVLSVTRLKLAGKRLSTYLRENDLLLPMQLF